MDHASQGTLLTIGTVARSFGVSENNLRRMEAAGLIRPACINEKSGYRYYDVENLSQISTILTLKQFGFVYDEIREHLSSGGDYTPLLEILLEQRKHLEILIKKISRRIPVSPRQFYQCEVAEYQEACCFTRTFSMVPSLSLIAQYSRELFFEAVQSGLPVDYTRTILLISDCLDYHSFQSDRRQDITFCVPLREKRNGPGLSVIPATNLVSFAWDSPGILYTDIAEILEETMRRHSLRQSDTLRVAYDSGGAPRGHAGTGTIMHILIPVEEAE